jgi:RNA-directed DNA polymerase
MRRESHVRFWERPGVKLPRATRRNIYVRSIRSGKRVMASVTRFLSHKLKLKVNESKSCVAQAWEREFLGFSITRGASQMRSIGARAIERFKRRVREITRRNRGASLARVVEELAIYVRGWIGYFGFCEARYVLRNLDGWIRRRLRCYIWKQWKTFSRRRRGLMARGLGEADASWTAARSRGCWSTSQVPPLRRAFPNAYFDTVGYPRMYTR